MTSANNDYKTKLQDKLFTKHRALWQRKKLQTQYVHHHTETQWLDFDLNSSQAGDCVGDGTILGINGHSKVNQQHTSRDNSTASAAFNKHEWNSSYSSYCPAKVSYLDRCVWTEYDVQLDLGSSRSQVKSLWQQGSTFWQEQASVVFLWAADNFFQCHLLRSPVKAENDVSFSHLVVKCFNGSGMMSPSFLTARC